MGGQLVEEVSAPEVEPILKRLLSHHELVHAARHCLLQLLDGLVLPLRHELRQVLIGAAAAAVTYAVGSLIGANIARGLADPACGRELLHRMRARSEEPVDDGKLRFEWAQSAGAGLGGTVDVRPVGAEQSNSSVVFGDALILKAFRRVEPGVNPELELLRFLSERSFAHIAPLAGWYEYAGRLVDATLGTLQEYLSGAREGWALCLEDLEAFVPRARELGAVSGELHSCLASDAGDADFAPEEPSTESLSLLTATVDEEIERMFVDLDPDDPALGALAGRGIDVRERLHVNINEVGELDNWQRAELGTAVVSGDRGKAFELIDEIVRVAMQAGGAEIFAIAKTVTTFEAESLPFTPIDDRTGSGDKAQGGDDWVPDEWRDEVKSDDV